MTETRTPMQPKVCVRCGRIVKITHGDAGPRRRCTGCGGREANCDCPKLGKLVFGESPTRFEPANSKGD